MTMKNGNGKAKDHLFEHLAELLFAIAALGELQVTERAALVAQLAEQVGPVAMPGASAAANEARAALVALEELFTLSNARGSDIGAACKIGGHLMCAAQVAIDEGIFEPKRDKRGRVLPSARMSPQLLNALLHGLSHVVGALVADDGDLDPDLEEEIIRRGRAAETPEEAAAAAHAAVHEHRRKH